MKIAVTSQDRKTITGHAGKCLIDLSSIHDNRLFAHALYFHWLDWG